MATYHSVITNSNCDRSSVFNEEDIGDFIVDAEGQPIHGKKKKRKAIYTDAYVHKFVYKFS